jgi:hypothetical protein
MKMFMRKDNSHVVLLHDTDKENIKKFEDNEEYMELFEFY